MQPKLIAASIAAALAAVSAPLHAGPFDRDEVKAMAYVALPFGGMSRSQQAPILGFALDHVRREQNGGFSYHPSLFQMTPASSVRALMDVRYNTHKANWDRFRVGGVDALTYNTKLNADGTTEMEATGISTGAIVAGVVVGVVVVHQATKDDDNASAGGGCGGVGAPPCAI